MATREDEWKAMMVRALDGDAAAYTSLLRQLAPQLRTFFRHRIAATDVTEDLVQETLMALHTRRASFDRDRPFSPWLFAIARHKIVDHFRKRRHSSLPDELEALFAANDPEPEMIASIEVDRLLDTLPAKQNRVIRATKIEGLSMAEAAAAEGIGLSDAKVSVFRGLKQLSAKVQGKLS